MIKHSEYLSHKKDLVSAKDLMDQDLYDLYMKIFLAQEEFSSKCGILPEQYKKFETEILPALHIDDIILDDNLKSLLEKLLSDLAAVISEVNPGMNFSYLKDNFKSDADSLLHGLVQLDYPLLEKKATENKLALDEFIFVIHNVFKPLMVKMREGFNRKISKEDWIEGICPFCGYLPDISKIVESKENQRHLHCAICENEWEFPRLLCPVCGCDEQAKHGYFEFEDNNLYRVYYCSECMHYIKNLRVPKLSEDSKFDLAVEDIITSFLDASMIEKGYKRI
jgi:formate dehydrogenase accessory protein FdhE